MSFHLRPRPARVREQRLVDELLRRDEAISALTASETRILSEGRVAVDLLDEFAGFVKPFREAVAGLALAERDLRAIERTHGIRRPSFTHALPTDTLAELYLALPR